MKALILLLALVLGVGCGEKPLTKEESGKVIEAAIRKAAKKPTGELTKADLEKVTSLDLYNNQLTDVKGLEKLTRLKELVLMNCKLTEVPKGLENLTQLERLYLQNNQLTNVKGLEKLTQLTFLRLDDNKLTSVKGLEKLTKLEELTLNHNQLTDVEGLEKLTQLTFLRLDENKLTSVKGLEKLTQIRQLILNNNPDLTKAQIAELKKALWRFKIYSNPTK